MIASLLRGFSAQSVARLSNTPTCDICGVIASIPQVLYLAFTVYPSLLSMSFDQCAEGFIFGTAKADLSHPT